VPQLPVPLVDVTVTVNEYVFAGVAFVVAIVRVGLGAELVSVGLKLVVTPAGVPPVKATVSVGVHTAPPVQVLVIGYVALLPCGTGFGFCAPTVTAVTVCGATTNVAVELMTELAPQFPVPPVEVAVTVKFVDPPGVAFVVLIVSVEVGEAFETVVGLNAAAAPVGAVQLIVSGTEVQLPLPVQVVVIE
jgi:hypothetical protein